VSALILDALTLLIRAAGAVALLALAAFGCWALRRNLVRRLS
jgi:hypothetical protein